MATLPFDSQIISNVDMQVHVQKCAVGDPEHIWTLKAFLVFGYILGGASQLVSG